MGTRANGGYQPTQPKPVPELSFNHSAGELMAVTVKKIRKEALRLIREATKNRLRDQEPECIGYIAGVAGLANALIGEEEGGE